MSIPINGRIAIIDDDIKQTEPLIRTLSKNQLPYVFYKGNDVDYLPDENSRYNDIRVLFLDINLVDEKASFNDKLVKSTLISILKRVISTKNFPYALILWSRHQEEKKNIVDEIFQNELNDRKPIFIKKFIKSDFFPNFSDSEQENNLDILQELKSLINSEPAYSYLLKWENQVHLSADNTLQNIFSSYHTFNDWSNNANYLLNKLGLSYSGRFYSSQEEEEKIKSAYNTLTYLINDTLEKRINSIKIENASKLNVDDQENNFDSLFVINTKLLFSSDADFNEYPGTIVEDNNDKSDVVFKEVLNHSFNRGKVKDELSNDEVSNKTEPQIEKLANKKCSAKRKEIRQTWKKIYLNVTPLCDYVQKKYNNNRCIKGIIIEEKFASYIDSKSEAVFISPKFDYQESIFVLVLNFRYFFTQSKGLPLKNINPILRTRQQLLSEIQSKLSRHISRQGILFLDDRL